MNWFEVVILSLIEGLTEFLPVSSTGHLILTANVFGINEDAFVKSFNIIIQCGAILSVLTIYWKRFLPNLEFYKKLVIAFLPAAVIGLAIKSKIDVILGSASVVAWALIIGGIILIWSDKYFKHLNDSGLKIEDLNWQSCLKLGLLQCFAFIPGVSRAGATIIGGLFLKMNRKEAAEFSFFLAVPTLTGAAVVKGIGALKTIEPEQIKFLIAGTALSYVFALIAIRFFISLLAKYGFKHFGYYRILLGLFILITLYRG